MNKERAIELVAKLEGLANSTANKEEAALAASRMQGLITKYRIEKAELENTDYVVNGFVLFNEKKRFKRWKIHLASVLAKHNSCVILVCKRDSEVSIIGVEENTRAVSYMFNYLVREIERLSANYIRLRKLMKVKSTKSTSTSFKLGCVDEIRVRLREKRVNILDGVSTEGLVKLNKEMELANEYADKISGNGTVNMGSSKNDIAAYRSGRNAGGIVSLDNDGKGMLG